MRKPGQPVPFRWVRDKIAGQRVFRSNTPGYVPVDIETGFLGRHHTYRFLAEALTRNDGDVTLAERPGFGGLKGLPGPCEISQLVEVKKARLDARRQELGDRHARFVLVGHSMGSAITVAFAERYPDMVASIIDVNGIGDPHPEWSLAEWDWRALRSLAPAEVSASALVPYVEVVTRGYADAVGSIMRHPTPAFKHAFFCADLDNRAAESAVGRAGIPVTIVRASSDMLVPESSLHARADRMEVPPVGHTTARCGRYTLDHENHLLGNTVPEPLRLIVQRHMVAAVDHQIELIGPRSAVQPLARNLDGGRTLTL